MQDVQISRISRMCVGGPASPGSAYRLYIRLLHWVGAMELFVTIKRQPLRAERSFAKESARGAIRRGRVVGISHVDICIFLGRSSGRWMAGGGHFRRTTGGAPTRRPALPFQKPQRAETYQAQSPYYYGHPIYRRLFRRMISHVSYFASRPLG